MPCHHNSQSHLIQYSIENKSPQPSNQIDSPPPRLRKTFLRGWGEEGIFLENENPSYRQNPFRRLKSAVLFLSSNLLSHLFTFRWVFFRLSCRMIWSVFSFLEDHLGFQPGEKLVNESGENSPKIGTILETRSFCCFSFVRVLFSSEISFSGQVFHTNGVVNPLALSEEEQQSWKTKKNQQNCWEN